MKRCYIAMATGIVLHCRHMASIQFTNVHLLRPYLPRSIQIALGTWTTIYCPRSSELEEAMPVDYITLTPATYILVLLLSSSTRHDAAHSLTWCRCSKRSPSSSGCCPGISAVRRSDVKHSVPLSARVTCRYRFRGNLGAANRRLSGAAYPLKLFELPGFCI